MIIKVGGQLYGSSEEMKEIPILSGNFASLDARLPYDPDSGALDFVSNRTVVGQNPLAAVIDKLIQSDRWGSVAQSSPPDAVFEPLWRNPNWEPMTSEWVKG